MKKLLTLLAIALTLQCVAQTKIGVIKGINTLHLKIGTVVLDGNNPGALRNATFAEELLFLIQDYEEDCYNDSIKYKGGWVKQYENGDIIIIGDPVIRDTITIDKCGNEYYHKKPTFKGFSDWLKDKGHRK